MGSRTKARKRALDILFESEQRGLDVGETLAERRAQADPPLNPYVAELVEGIQAQSDEINARISANSVGWAIDRMPAVDRALLRIGVYELAYSAEVPTAVAISEAVALAKELSTDDSPAFINGVLSSVAEALESA